MAVVIADPIEYRSYCLQYKEKGFSIGFVPTMGALHKGHLELVKRARRENDLCAVSIFVNPTQFDDQKDLNEYPDHFDDDLKKLESFDIDCVFAPYPSAMYPRDYNFRVTESQLSKKLCGQYRIGHFDGVLSVVLKLLNLSQADRAYFGEKDYQQYLLIKDMVEAFFLNTEIVPVGIIREESGLAMSSRNQRLSTNGLTKAARLYFHLNESVRNNSSAKEVIQNLLGEGFEVQYVEDFENRRFAAVFLEGVRLIDNVSL